MATTPLPLAMPEDLLKEVRTVASETGLSNADVIRQSIKLGLPKLREQLRTERGRVTNVDPLPAKMLNRLYAEREDEETSIRRFIAAQPKGSE
jgi:hypothetical protein